MEHVEGVFRILDRASPVLDKIERRAKAVDKAMDRAGRTMDKFAEKSSRDMRVAEDGVNKFGDATDRTSTKVSASFEAMDRVISQTTSSAQRNLGELQTQMALVDSQTMNPEVDIDITGAMAQLKTLSAEIDAVNRKKISIGSGGGAATSGVESVLRGQNPGFFRRIFAKGGSMVAQEGSNRLSSWARSKINNSIDRVNPFSALNRAKRAGVSETEATYDKFVSTVSKSGGVFGSVGERMGSWLKIIAAAGPLLESVAGAAGSLVGSLGGAALGAGAGLAGILGTATVGLGGFMGVLAPVVSELKLAKKAQDSYNKAVVEYGKNSSEAQKKLAIYERTGSKGARRTLDAWSELKESFKNRTGRGRQEAFGLMGDSLTSFRTQFAPQIAGIGNQSATALRSGGNNFFETLDSPTFHRNLDILSKTFDKVTPMFGTSMANLARVMSNISAAARPQVIEFFKWLNGFLANANKGTSNLNHLEKLFKGYTREFKLWVRLFKEIGLLTLDFFGAGRKSGDSLVKEWTSAIHGVRSEWQKDPTGLESWFGKQTDNFKKLLREIGSLAKVLAELVDSLTAVIGPITEASKFVRESVGGGLPGSIAQIATSAGLYLGAGALGRGAMRSIGKRIPGGVGDWFLKKGGLKRIPGTAGPSASLVQKGEEMALTSGEGGAGAGAVMGASRLMPFLSEAAGPAGLAAASIYGFQKLSHGGGGPRNPVTGGSALAGFDPSTSVRIAQALGLVPTYALGHMVSKIGQTSHNPFEPVSRREVSRAVGGMPTIMGAYLHGGMGATGAFQKALDPGLGALKRAGPEGSALIATNMVAWANQQRRDNPKLEGVYDELVESIKHKYSEMGRHIAIVNGEIFAGSQKQWEKIASAITSPAARAVEANKTAFTTMQMQAVGSLMGMGYKKSTAMQIVQGMEAGRIGANAEESSLKGFHGQLDPHFRKRQAGGTIPGSGRQDSVMMGGAMVAPGESWIATRHQREQINRNLPEGLSVEKIIGGNKRWHSSPPAGGHYAAGGKIHYDGHPADLHPGIRSVLAGVEGQFPGLVVTATTDGVHVSGSEHYANNAVDISGSSGEMFKASEWIKKSGMYRNLSEGIHNPNLSVSEGKFVPSSFYSAVWAEHANHIHLADKAMNPIAGLRRGATGGGGATLGPKHHLNIKVPKTKLGGIPGAMNQRVMDIYGKGLEGKINNRLGGGGGGRHPHVAGGSVEAQIARTLFGHGANKIGAAGIIGNAEAESSMDPGAEGTGGGGLWGFTAGEISLANLKKAGGPEWESPAFQTNFMLEHGGQQLIPLLNKVSSPEAAAQLFMEKWERPGIPRLGVRQQGARTAFQHGYQSGGPMGFAGWMAKGGTFTVDRPTLFGAGEAGAEDVHVRPRDISKASKGGSASGVHVHIAKIENHEPGDIRKIIDREFSKAGIAMATHVEAEDNLQ